PDRNGPASREACHLDRRSSAALEVGLGGCDDDKRSEVLAGRSGVGSSRGSGRRCRIDVAGLREFRHVSRLSRPGAAIQIGGAGTAGIESLPRTVVLWKGFNLL